MSQLHKAYVGLTFAAKNEDGTRTVPIKRFGTFEVRLAYQGRPPGSAGEAATV